MLRKLKYNLRQFFKKLTTSCRPLFVLLDLTSTVLHRFLGHVAYFILYFSIWGNSLFLIDASSDVIRCLIHLANLKCHLVLGITIVIFTEWIRAINFYSLSVWNLHSPTKFYFRLTLAAFANKCSWEIHLQVKQHILHHKHSSQRAERIQNAFSPDARCFCLVIVSLCFSWCLLVYLQATIGEIAASTDLGI